MMMQSCMTPEEREARILSLAKIVQQLANLRRRTLPQTIALVELVSAGWLGAIQAVDSFDPARNILLTTYATHKIRSAMADYLRSIDNLTRHHRLLIKAGEGDAPMIFSLDPWADSASIYADTPRALTLVADRRAASNQAALDARLTLRSLYRRAALKPRHASVLKRFYNGEELTAIGKSIGVGQSRASQICIAAVAQLRRAA